MKIVTGVGESNHVTSKEHRCIIEGLAGTGSYILECGEALEPELVSNNLLKIHSGAMCHHGNVSYEETYAEIELTNGTQGVKRIDLIVNRYSRNDDTQIESNDWIVIMGEPSSSDPVAPDYIVGNVQDDDLIDDCPVFEVEFDGINIVEIRTLLNVVPSIDVLKEKVEALTSKAEADPAIEYGVLAGVTVPAKSFSEYKVTFNEAFTAAPAVVVTPKGNYNITCQVKSASKTGFTLNVRSLDGAQRTDRDFSWIAIGKR